MVDARGIGAEDYALVPTISLWRRRRLFWTQLWLVETGQRLVIEDWRRELEHLRLDQGDVTVVEVGAVTWLRQRQFRVLDLVAPSGALVQHA